MSFDALLHKLEQNIAISCQTLSYHDFCEYRVCFLMNICHFHAKQRKKEKSVVSFTHEQTSVCRSHGGLSANGKEDKFAYNDNDDGFA